MVIGFGAVLLSAFPALDSANAPAWVQAIGSVVGIAIAIVVPLRLHKKAIERERERQAEEVRDDLQSLREEIFVVYSGIITAVAGKLVDPLPDGIYLYTLRPDFNACVVYLSMGNRIGRIPDPILRHKIIATYGSVRGLMSMFVRHADFWAAFDAAEAELHAQKHSAHAIKVYERQRDRVKQASASLLKFYPQVVNDMDLLIIEIDKKTAAMK